MAPRVWSELVDGGSGNGHANRRRRWTTAASAGDGRHLVRLGQGQALGVAAADRRLFIQSPAGTPRRNRTRQYRRESGDSAVARSESTGRHVGVGRISVRTTPGCRTNGEGRRLTRAARDRVRGLLIEGTSAIVTSCAAIDHGGGRL